MFTFTVAIKRAYLRSVYATLGGVTLLAALAAKSIAAATVIESGQVVRSTSSSDVSVEFAEPGKGAPTPSEMVEMWESLVDDYDLAVYYLNQDGITSPTDAQIYTLQRGRAFEGAERRGNLCGGGGCCRLQRGRAFEGAES